MIKFEEDFKSKNSINVVVSFENKKSLVMRLSCVVCKSIHASPSMSKTISRNTRDHFKRNFRLTSRCNILWWSIVKSRRSSRMVAHCDVNISALVERVNVEMFYYTK
jgi:hypothetical protein